MVRPASPRPTSWWIFNRRAEPGAPAKDGDMAAFSHNSSRAPKSRALAARFAGAAIVLAAFGDGAHAQTVGPVANFGPASIDVQSPQPPAAPAAPAPDAQPLRESARDAGDPESRPLLAPSRKVAAAAVDGAATSRPAESSSWLRVAGALALVLALIFVARAALKRVAAKGGLRGQFGAGGRAPSGVLEVLGRYPVSRGQSLVLLRVDQRVLLLSQAGTGFRTLANFDDPSDVASLLMRTRDEESESLSGRFKQMLSAFERDPATVKGTEHIDLSRRAPLVQRRPSLAPGKGVQRVATPQEAHDAIRKRLHSLREAVA